MVEARYKSGPTDRLHRSVPFRMNQPHGRIIEAHYGDTLAYNATLERLREVVPFKDAVVLTTLPRGGLQVTQPRQTDPVRMRLYMREAHAFDVLAWTVMAHEPGTALRTSDLAEAEHEGNAVSGAAEVAEQFEALFLVPHGFGPYAAVSIDGPVLEGFPGVIQVFRESGADDFTKDDLARLSGLADELALRFAQRHEDYRFKQNRYPMAHRPVRRQFALRQDGTILFPSPDATGPLAKSTTAVSDPAANNHQLPGSNGDAMRHGGTAQADAPWDVPALSDTLSDNLRQLVRLRLEAAGDALEAAAVPEDDDAAALELGDESMRDALQATAAGSNADRLLVPDESGDCWAFRLSLFPRYPALTGNLSDPVAIASVQPECESWSALRASDFAADDEIGRLIPALHYMQEHYRGSASLQSVARTVHLSPYHFHRRFTELLGITPKHYLFDCQVSEAKRKLAARELDLRQIAEHCGFAHQSHFTSRFRQGTGLTPTKWRRLAEAVEKREG